MCSWGACASASAVTDRVCDRNWECAGYVILMSPTKSETAVLSCHCQGDMVVCMRIVLVIPRGWHVNFSAFFAVVYPYLALSYSTYLWTMAEFMLETNYPSQLPLFICTFHRCILLTGGEICWICLNFTALAQFLGAHPRANDRWLTDQDERVLLLCYKGELIRSLAVKITSFQIAIRFECLEVLLMIRW